jgi:hypothetical protein
VVFWRGFLIGDLRLLFAARTYEDGNVQAEGWAKTMTKKGALVFLLFFKCGGVKI